MQVVMQVGQKGKPKIYELTKDKANLLIKFAEFLVDDPVDVNSPDDIKFFESEIIRALKTKRTKSGNSLRTIIDRNDTTKEKEDSNPLYSYEDGKKEFQRIKKSIESGLNDAKNIISGKKQGKLLSDLLNEE
jgi:hypothetical protein